MKNTYFIQWAMVLSALTSCVSKEETQSTKQPTSHDPNTIELVAQKLPGEEAIPYAMPVHTGLDKLEFGSLSDLTLEDEDLVLGITKGDLKIALPLKYLEGFEVANFSLKEEKYLITWCSLVGSAQMFTGNIEGDTTGFDFGRALIDNNLLMVDRKTQSVWNQLSNEAVHGALKGTKLDLEPTIQTTWAYWKNKYPDTKVLINKDTTGAAFPSLVFENPRYTDWQPGNEKFYTAKDHQPENLGLGLEIKGSAVYFPIETLFKKASPIKYKILDETILIHFDESGMTAWAEDSEGNLLPSTLAYNWAWKNFHSETLILKD